MPDNRNTQEWKEHKNDPSPQNNQAEGSKENVNDQQRPQDRLNDGTNDYKNGDQDTASETSKKPGQTQ